MRSCNNGIDSTDDSRCEYLWSSKLSVLFGSLAKWASPSKLWIQLSHMWCLGEPEHNLGQPHDGQPDGTVWFRWVLSYGFVRCCRFSFKLIPWHGFHGSSMKVTVPFRHLKFIILFRIAHTGAERSTNAETWLAVMLLLMLPLLLLLFAVAAASAAVIAVMI